MLLNAFAKFPLVTCTTSKRYKELKDPLEALVICTFAVNDVFVVFVQNEMLEEGHEYAVMLYTWRSCSRAIPQVIHKHTTHMHLIRYLISYFLLHPCRLFLVI